MKPTKITVTAGPGRSCPLPSLRSPTGAPVVLLAAAPAGRERHPHELVGPIEIDLTDAIAAHYVRGRLAAGDLVEQPAATSSTTRTTAKG